MKQANTYSKQIFQSFLGLIVAVGLIIYSDMVRAEGFFQGAKLCEECHEEEYKIWQKTKHFTSFRVAHREPKDPSKPSPKKILAAVGGHKRMKRNETCYLCHYTLVKKDAGAKSVAKSGPSCENCHGVSSDWLPLHDDYGGKDVKKSVETADHKAERIADSKTAGMIWPAMKYEIAEKCMICHGLANPDLKAEDLAKMLGAGHPINPDFELVKYSQGSIRHRFYAPNMKINAEMTPQEQAELFIIGQAAAWVSANGVMSKIDNPKYKEAQNKRAENAKIVLSTISSFPEVGALLSSPTRENALKLVVAISGKDLTSAVGSKLPAKADYK